LSQSGERPEPWAESFINRTLSKLEYQFGLSAHGGFEKWT
jgi:hypothetical protein